MTRTRRVTRDGCGRGTTMACWLGVGQDAGDVEHVLGLEAEVELLHDGLAEQLDQGGGLARAATGIRPTRRGAIQLIAARSRRTRVATSGRCTFTTTLLPVRRRAAWTWATDAAAMGVRSNSLNCLFERHAQVAPRRCAAPWRRARRGPGPDTRRNSVTSSSGNRPSPDDRIWPSLM